MTYFVLAFGNKGCSDAPFILNLRGGTKEDAERAIRWQQIGQGQLYGFKIATYDPKRSDFVALDGTPYVPERGPYTQEAWEAFLAAPNSYGAVA